MKKFLVILMVLVMASVLFVGCTTPPTPTPEPEPEPTPTPIVSATPVLTAVETSLGAAIFDVTSTATLYMNIAQVGSSILVRGTAPSESLVKIYLGDVAVGPAVAETAVTGLWTVAIAKSSLGDDGVKVLTAKVTEVGLAEGAASNAVTFTLDTVRPSATTLAATINAAAVALGITSTSSTVTAGVAMVDSFSVAGAAGTLAAGTWTVKTLAASGNANNVAISDGTTVSLYTVAALTLFDGAIPGIKFQIPVAALVNPGNTTTLIINAAVNRIPDRAKVGFSEEITTASAILAANYTWTDAATAITSAATYSSKYAYFNTFTTPAVGLAVLNATLRCSVNGVIDLAGNSQTTASALTCTVAAASATSLAP